MSRLTGVPSRELRDTRRGHGRLVLIRVESTGRREDTYKFLLLLGAVFIHKDHSSFEDCEGERNGMGLLRHETQAARLTALTHVQTQIVDSRPRPKLPSLKVKALWVKSFPPLI